LAEGEKLTTMLFIALETDTFPGEEPITYGMPINGSDALVFPATEFANKETEYDTAVVRPVIVKGLVVFPESVKVFPPSSE
jgi:hypothetical protein